MIFINTEYHIHINCQLTVEHHIYNIHKCRMRLVQFKLLFQKLP